MVKELLGMLQHTILFLLSEREKDMKEEWKDVKGYEGLYQVSNKGRVRNAKGEIKATRLNYPGGYLTVCLYKNNTEKRLYSHRLVAQAFIPNPNNLKYVNHIDENRTNNTLENLEWCTAKYNSNYGNCRKHMSENQWLKRKVVCVETGVEYDSIVEASKSTNTHHSSICNVLKNRAKTGGGYHWQYLE